MSTRTAGGASELLGGLFELSRGLGLEFGGLGPITY